MIAVIDYGAGNIFSVKNALDFIGYENRLTDKKEDIENADAIILPRCRSVSVGNGKTKGKRTC